MMLIYSNEFGVCTYVTDIHTHMHRLECGQYGGTRNERVGTEFKRTADIFSQLSVIFLI